MEVSTPRTIGWATWARMLAKADAEHIEIRQLGSGLWIATSGTDPDAAYEVNLHDCECPGHAYHTYCKHRAALAAKLGHLSVVATAPREPTPDGQAEGPGSADVVEGEADGLTRYPLGRARRKDHNQIAA